MQEQELDLDHIQWSSPEWIFTLPTRTLSSPDEALDYFVLSPFFNPQSNNGHLRTQKRVFDPTYGAFQERFDLPTYRGGFEYVIGHTHPPDLFVVHRRDVEANGSRENVTGAWFILEGKIYPSPNIYDVMANRLKNASFLLSSTFQTLSSSHPASNPRTHSSWRSLPPQVSETEPDSSASSQPASTSGPNFALLNALASTRQSLGDLDKMATTPAPAVNASDELRRIEEEIMGTAAVPTGAATNIGGKSVKTSVAPVNLGKERERDFGRTGTPGARLLGRTPAVAPSPLASQGG